MKKTLLKCTLLIAIITLTLNTQAQKAYQYGYLYKDLPFEMPKIDIPALPECSVSITDFGAKGNGMDLCTNAFSNAMNSLSSKGGGTVVVPVGVWLTGPIVFKSNINLHLEKGAIILFSHNKDLYPIVETIFEGLATKRCQSPISGRNLTNVAITGDGAIDGNGQYWRPLKKQSVTESYWKKFIAGGGVFRRADYWYPSEQYLKGQQMSDMNVPRSLKTDDEWNSIKDFLRPVMVNFIECKNLYLQGVLFQNSPAWNLHPLMCENVILDGVTVRNPSYAENGDGIDLESCKNTLIVNSSFDVGDDGICIKSGKDEEGRKRGRACENLIVDNCTVFKGHGGFVVGSEMSGGARNMKVANCKFIGTDVGLRFKSKRGRGGVVENIFVENIAMMDIVTEPLLFDLYYMGKSAVEAQFDSITGKPVLPKVDETTPTFRNIHIKNISCTNANRAMYFNGLPENQIEGIYVENATISCKKGGEIKESKHIVLKNILIKQSEGPALKILNCKDIDMKDVPGEIIKI
ncbi:MAG: glycoside hydrolase family 28 protein [Paludibacter sp.]|nr:glycoside hydrolase family 28 protein [Paludibacter sp.]